MEFAVHIFSFFKKNFDENSPFVFHLFWNFLQFFLFFFFIYFCKSGKDCCDGSDEFEKRVDCQNQCKKAGEHEFLKVVQEIQLHEKGAELKIQLIKEAQAIKPTIHVDTENLRSQLEFARTELSEVEKRETLARELANEAEALVDDESEDYIREDEEVDDEEKRLKRADPTRATLQMEFEEKHGILPSQAITSTSNSVYSLSLLF